MKGYRLVALLNIILVISFIAPLIYGLYISDWNLQTFLGINRLIKRIDLEVEAVSMDYNYTHLTVNIRTRNIGNVNFGIKAIYTNITLSDKQLIFQGGYNLKFDRAVALEEGGSIPFKLVYEVGKTPTGAAIPLTGEYSLELTFIVEYQGEEYILETTLSGSYMFKR